MDNVSFFSVITILHLEFLLINKLKSLSSNRGIWQLPCHPSSAECLYSVHIQSHTGRCTEYTNTFHYYFFVLALAHPRLSHAINTAEKYMLASIENARLLCILLTRRLRPSCFLNAHAP